MNKKNDIIKTFFYIILIMPFFEPRSITFFYPKVSKIIFDYIPIIYLIFIIIFTVKNTKLSSSLKYILLFFTVYFFSTILNNGDIKSLMLLFCKTMSFTYLIDDKIKKNDFRIINAINILMIVYLIINFITIIIYPKGMYVDGSGYLSNWFLGFKNIHILFIIPGIISNCLLAYIKYNKIRLYNYIYILICLLFLIRIDSGTSIVCLLIILGCTLFSKRIPNSKFNNINLLTILYIAVFVSIVILRVQNIFSFIIVDILHKDLTFTNRTYIWDDVIKMIINKPLIGYGMEFRSLRLLKTSIPSYHAHCQWLEIFYSTGILGTTSIVLLLNKCRKKFKRFEKNCISIFLKVCILALFYMMITESYSLNGILYIFIITCHMEKFIIRNEVIKDEKNIKKNNVINTKGIST